jgi:hypothetical protein
MSRERSPEQQALLTDIRDYNRPNEVVVDATTAAATPAQAVEAIKVLADAAASPAAAPPAVVASVANIAASAATTQEGVSAINALAQQGATPAAGDPEQVAAAVQVAVESVDPDADKNYEAHKAKRQGTNISILPGYVWSVDNRVSEAQFDEIKFGRNLDTIAFIINDRRAIKNMAEVEQYLAHDFGIVLKPTERAELINSLRQRDSVFYGEWR